MDPIRVRRVAEETAGWTAVTGKVIAAGGRLRISARAYDVVTSRELVRAVELGDQLPSADRDVAVALKAIFEVQDGAAHTRAARGRRLQRRQRRGTPVAARVPRSRPRACRGRRAAARRRTLDGAHGWADHWPIVGARRLAVLCKLRRYAPAHEIAEGLWTGGLFTQLSPAPTDQTEALAWAFNVVLMRGDFARTDSALGKMAAAIQ